MTATVDRSSALFASLPMSPHAAVAELGQAALGGLPLNEFFKRVTDLVCNALDVEFSKVLRQPTPGSRLIVVASAGWGPEVEVGASTVSSRPTSQAGYTMATHEPVMVDDVSKESRFEVGDSFVRYGVRSGMSVVIPDHHRPYGILAVHTRIPRRFTIDEGDFLRSIANVISGTVQNQRARDRIEAQANDQERRLRFQTALATCAQMLLTNTGGNRLDKAVEALLTATQATYVFVERNQVDPELGFCSRTVTTINDPTTTRIQDHDGYWNLVPWERMPISRRSLEKGEPFTFTPGQLEGVEYDLYASEPDPVKSELNIPIFVAGKWDGLIGFSDTTTVREWTAEDISLLTTAATMIGAFWESESARENREQLLRAKDEFLASVSHELRTPLTAVVGFGEILRDTGHLLSETERHEFLQLLVTQGSDVSNIVNDLLVAAKADIGSLNVSRVNVNLRAQIAQVVENVDPDLRARINVLDTIDVRALGDPDRIRQVVRNLINNASHYGGPSIEIRLLEDETPRLQVCDNGRGIPDEDRERIFQPYQRAHNAQGVAGSLGLGLSISRQLAHLMGGDLVYRYDDNESIFELTLPRAE
ncbi:MAG: GAF domain-containing protein [Acidimicrobiia bacterium]|nr:GAF domain-containing protein [Acidimicrobiia bacterium]